ncbi:hypothetical protein HA466_0076080 [Hirschfeldia incana]|nr:hypothetical protein HA466_0076080 [Hirschfeldia incana]
MAGEGPRCYQPPLVGVWWDLNTCPVPADVNPLCVHRIIKSVLLDEIRFPTTTAIHVIGNLEYLSSDLLEKISSCGIILIHSPCGGKNLSASLRDSLSDWYSEVRSDPQHPGYGNIMLISGDSTMVDCLHEFSGLSKFYAYPKDVRPLSPVDNQGEKLFVKAFVWETLLSDNEASCSLMVPDYESHLMCEVCYFASGTYEDFITHFKSEQHRKGMFEIVPMGCDKPTYFCPTCNYPAYNELNLSLHNKSEDHYHKLLAEKELPPQAEDCESRKRNPQVDLSNKINKKQSLERA